MAKLFVRGKASIEIIHAQALFHCAVKGKDSKCFRCKSVVQRVDPANERWLRRVRNKGFTQALSKMRDLVPRPDVIRSIVPFSCPIIGSNLELLLALIPMAQTQIVC